ncbi:MAG: sugar phosphate isomerase/epimerase [Clostridia bacterium]|nr:sugar phosphate isomerase/epimerase [Clostridia bacterium]
MELGMYSIELRRPSIETLFEAISSYGFKHVQFDFLSVCDEEMPRHIDSSLTARIRKAADNNGVNIVSVNGTFNMIDPDPDKRSDGLRRFEELAKHMHELDCRFVTLCTGSRSTESMWRGHPDNQTEAAWNDLLSTMRSVLDIAERYDLILGLETEPNNVMNTAELCRKLIESFNNTPRLQVIMDIANLFRPGMAHKENVRPTMRHAFDLLGDRVYLAHGKDIMESDSVRPTYAGNGIVDFAYFKELLEEIEYPGCLLLHGLHNESEFPEAPSFIHGIFG